MKRTLALFVNNNDNLTCGWRAGRNQYFLESNWTYTRPDRGFGLRDELKNLESDYDRVNKKFNIFRHDNEHYFYSDGNTDPWIIMSHFILEMFSRATGKDYRGRYLHKKRITLINEKSDLIPSNIKVDSMLLSDIIRVIFNSEDSKELEDYKCVLDYCDDTNDMDELFKDKVSVDHVFSMYNELTLDDQKDLLKRIIEEKLT